MPLKAALHVTLGFQQRHIAEVMLMRRLQILSSQAIEYTKHLKNVTSFCVGCD